MVGSRRGKQRSFEQVSIAVTPIRQVGRFPNQPGRRRLVTEVQGCAGSHQRRPSTPGSSVLPHRLDRVLLRCCEVDDGGEVIAEHLLDSRFE